MQAQWVPHSPAYIPGSHDPRQGSPQACRAAKLSCSTEESSTSMDWPCCQVTKAPAVWITVRGEDVHWRSTQTV